MAHNSQRFSYRLEGLSCMNCAVKFEKNVRQLPNVEEAQINFGASKLTLKGEATVQELEKAGAFDGIKVIPDHQPVKIEKQSFWKRENILALISLLFTIIGIFLYVFAGENSLLAISTFLLAILIGGYDLFKVGFRNLLQFEFDMKTLMTIAIIGAAIIGEWMEGAVVVFLFALSEALESYSINKARQSITSLLDIAPKKATVKHGNKTVEIDVNDIRINDVIIIKPGEKVAMDGEVIKGESTINQSAITGESIPVHKSFGDEVFAGTINEQGVLQVRVTKRVEDTTLAKIIHLVEEAQAERAPSQKFVDQFAKYYTPAILIIALLVAIFPPLFFHAAWSEWIYLGLAVLVVGCPCALVISTPVAIVTAIGNAARNGVLIKGGVYLEALGRLHAVAFDKTGTLTKGKPEVTDIASLNRNMDENDILQIALAIEKNSEHPLASAIVRRAQQKGVKRLETKHFQAITGKGAKAELNGTVFYIGNLTLIEPLITVPLNVREQILTLQKEGKTVMVVATNEALIGLIAVADQVRRQSSSVIKRLYDLGIKKTIMLTGDNEATGKAISKKLGLNEARTELLPEDKLKTIQKLQKQYGNVAMVGDGINDAPALATATVGIAMGSAGTDAALESADIALMGDNLEKLPYVITLGRKALNVIKQNISFALGLKIIALLLVIPGWLTLWLAIVADVGATLLVVLNSMRLVNEKNLKSEGKFNKPVPHTTL